jgi:hypothetical protein
MSMSSIMEMTPYVISVLGRLAVASGSCASVPLGRRVAQLASDWFYRGLVLLSIGDAAGNGASNGASNGVASPDRIVPVQELDVAGFAIVREF